MPKKKPISDEAQATISSRSEQELRTAIGQHAVARETIQSEMEADEDVIEAKAQLDAAKAKYKEVTAPDKADMSAESALLTANHEELMRRGLAVSERECSQL